ncbi:MAG: glycosyltransferase family 2 protein, partial [Acutalibacteraceae bacterium]
QQGFEAMLRYVRNVTAVHQECMMIRRQTWQALGGFACAPAGYEAVDLCLRGEEKGLSNVWTPYSAHKRNGHGKQADKHTQEFAEKWSERLAHDDAYYNPNLKKLGLV